MSPPSSFLKSRRRNAPPHGIDLIFGLEAGVKVLNYAPHIGSSSNIGEASHTSANAEDLAGIKIPSSGDLSVEETLVDMRRFNYGPI